MTAPRPIPVVIGTAGHIDHGKSALVYALTGEHPDRWEEEKRRGITIDLGYAQINYEDGLEIGFVDVPGHEKLVRKMVAGATGMGAVMLVVACDDGVMPQTREHFQVLQMLGIDRGLIVLSKTDLADDDTLLLARADVEELIANTTWAEVDILEVSAHRGDGLEELRNALRELALAARSEVDNLHAFRLPIQRSFALHGAGTVATGVCSSGSLQEGDVVEVMPKAKTSRVRRVQVHGRSAGQALPGLRTALNLPEFEAQDCPRGAVLATPGSVRAGALARIMVEPLTDAPPLEHGAEIQFLAGTAAVNGRVWLPPAGLLGALDGERPWIADIELDEELALIPGQRLVLRRPSPAGNQASGRFLSFGLQRLRRRDQQQRDLLLALASSLDQPDDLLVRMLEVLGEAVSVAALARELGWNEAAATTMLQAAVSRGTVRKVGGSKWTAAGRIGALGRDVAAAISGWRRQNPHRMRIPLTDLRDRLGKKKSQALVELDDADLEQVGLRKLAGTDWQLLDAEIDSEFAEVAARVFTALAAGGLAPLANEELTAASGVEPQQLSPALEYLQDTDQLVRISGGMLFARTAVEDLRNLVVTQLQQGDLDIPGLRDRFNTTRKFLMPLLEHLDARGVTERRGGNRLLRNAQAPL